MNEDRIITQQDIDEGTEFYCLCHGWQKPASLQDVCPNIYACAD